MVLNLGWKQIILGMPWLKKWNLVIDWVAKQINIPRPVGRRDGAPLHECLPSWTDSLVPQRYILHWLEMDADLKTAWHFEKWKAWLAGENIGKITISTQIAQETKSQEATLPDWCKDFEDVFSEKIHEKLPPHRLYNHVIDLKPSFTLKITKVYPLNPQEMETCKAFVEEHLKTGWNNLLCPEKGWHPSSLPRLLIPQFTHHSKCVSPTPNPRIDWWHEGLYSFH